MSKLLSFIAIPLAILVTLKYTGIYDASALLRYNITTIGALFLIAMQIISYIIVHFGNQGTTAMGKVIKTVLAVPGILYMVNMIYPINIGISLDILIAAFLFIEGLYGLH